MMIPDPSTLPAHFRLGPSSSSRWVYCPGSARTDLPDRQSDAADLGTLGHTVAELGINKLEVPADLEAQFAKYDPEAVAQVRRGIQTFIEYASGLPGEIRTELKLPSRSIKDFGGTIDVLGVTADRLHVVDFKSGTYFVRAKRNHQLMSYLVLARQWFGRRNEYAGTIVQPRVGDGLPQTAYFTNDDLDAFELQVIEASVSDEVIAGEHCSWCPLLINCDVAYARAKAMAGEDFQILQDDGYKMERMREIYEFGDVVAEMVKICATKMMEALTRGDAAGIEDYMITQGYGHRKWNRPDELKAHLEAKGYKPEQYNEPTKIKSPAQLEQLIDADMLEPYWAKPRTAPKMVKRESGLEEIVTGDDFGVIG